MTGRPKAGAAPARVVPSKATLARYAPCVVVLLCCCVVDCWLSSSASSPPPPYPMCGLQTACDSCLGNTFAEDPDETATVGAVECTLCPHGTTRRSNLKACTACPGGKFHLNQSDTVCTSCGQGTFASEPLNVNSVGATNCTDCPSGRFSTVTGTVKCSLCRAGEFQEAPGQTYCDACSGNTITDAAGKSTCDSCSPDRADTAKTTCLSCLKFEYVVAATGAWVVGVLLLWALLTHTVVALDLAWQRNARRAPTLSASI